MSGRLAKFLALAFITSAGAGTPVQVTAQVDLSGRAMVGSGIVTMPLPRGFCEWGDLLEGLEQSDRRLFADAGVVMLRSAADCDEVSRFQQGGADPTRVALLQRLPNPATDLGGPLTRRRDDIIHEMVADLRRTSFAEVERQMRDVLAKMAPGDVVTGAIEAWASDEMAVYITKVFSFSDVDAQGRSSARFAVEVQAISPVRGSLMAWSVMEPFGRGRDHLAAVTAAKMTAKDAIRSLIAANEAPPLTPSQAPARDARVPPQLGGKVFSVVASMLENVDLHRGGKFLLSAIGFAIFGVAYAAMRGIWRLMHRALR